MKRALFLSTLLFSFINLFAQNVGIGITNPTRAKLEVNGAVDATSAIFGGDSTGISLQRSWPGIGFNSYYNNGHRYMANGFGALQFLDPTSGVMAFDFFNNGNKNGAVVGRRALVISNDGWMNVGSASYPTHTLTVARGTSTAGTAAFSGSVYQSIFNSGPGENTYIRAGKNSGTVFINDIVSQGKVSLSGDIVVLQDGQTGFYIKHVGTLENWRYSIYGNGGTLGLHFNEDLKGTYNSSSGSYSAVSDARLKTNIKPLPPVTQKLMQLQPVGYEIINDNPSHEKSIGFIAQDVKRLFPELVTILSDTTHGYKGIKDLHTLNYSGLSVIAIKAIQEQQETIQSLQNEVAELKKAVIAMQKSNGILSSNQDKQ